MATDQVVWEYSTRTLLSGTPASPTNRSEEIALAVWTYPTRTLTSGNTGGAFVFNLQIG